MFFLESFMFDFPRKLSTGDLDWFLLGLYSTTAQHLGNCKNKKERKKKSVEQEVFSLQALSQKCCTHYNNASRKPCVVLFPCAFPLDSEGEMKVKAVGRSNTC